MEIGVHKVEACFRAFAILMFVFTAFLLGFDSETKFIVYIEKTVTYKDLTSLLVLMKIECVAAAYNLLQLILVNWFKGYIKGPNTYLAWACFLFDQIGAYITYSATTAAMGESMLVVSGVEILQWSKWCNRFTKFCFEIGGALFSAFLASLLMAFLSFISAFNLFRLYSPQHFLILKTHQIN